MLLKSWNSLVDSKEVFKITPAPEIVVIFPSIVQLMTFGILVPPNPLELVRAAPLAALLL